MDVEITHHVDAGEPDGQGTVDYAYEYDLHLFSEGGVSLLARSYGDEQDEAHFLRIERGGVRAMLTVEDMASPLALKAADYLRALGKRRLNWLDPTCGGYAPLEAAA